MHPHLHHVSALEHMAHLQHDAASWRARRPGDRPAKRGTGRRGRSGSRRGLRVLRPAV